MRNIYIGIDPSLNSTGICLNIEENGLIIERFFIIKPDTHERKKNGQLKDPLTKKERLALTKLDNFDYLIYDKEKVDKDLESYINEDRKIKSCMNILTCIEWIFDEYIEYDDNVIVCMEGVSYGSKIRTSAIFDLAGLNFMIRQLVLNKKFNLYVFPPSHIKKFAIGSGNAKKDIISDVFCMIHPEFNDVPKIDDIADAYFMMKLVKKMNNNGEL